MNARTLIGVGVIVVVGLAWAGNASQQGASSQRGGSAPAQGQAQPDLASALAEVRQRVPQVYAAEVVDDLLMIRVKGDWTDLGATRLACEDVKPVLAAHGVGDLMFAIYNVSGKVISTGSRCP
jgi:hypothetical protein